ncbi:MAG: AraC family transcriptional regulator [Clostridiales bacterium]|jgi:YesN/AraC family two-component response regulator|nr:AraC family transcriptional regulator [Clostridiales bacterium]
MIENQRILLDYFFELNRIPVWVVDANNEIEYSSATDGDLPDKAALASFFSYFKATAADKPQTVLVENREFFSYFCVSGGYIVIIGPCFTFPPVLNEFRSFLSVDFLFKNDISLSKILQSNKLSLRSYGKHVQALSIFFNGAYFTLEEIEKEVKRKSVSNLIDAELSKTIFDLREDEITLDYNYEWEKNILKYVESGNSEMAERGLKRISVRAQTSVAMLTKNQFEYEVVAHITLLTRAAIKGGLDVDTAFSLSDLFLNKISHHRTRDDLSEIAKNATASFADHVRDKKTAANNKYPPNIVKAVSIIKSKIHRKILLCDVASEIGYTPKYLSGIFIKEVGKGFNDFVINEKIVESCYLLKNTSVSIIEIANTFAFSSQSYFTKVFKSVMHITPQAYRGQSR